MSTNPWTLYKDVEHRLLAKEEMQNIIEKLTSTGYSDVDSEVLNSFLRELNVTLKELFRKLASHELLEKGASTATDESCSKEVFSLLYVNLHDPDSQSVVMDSTYVFFSCMERHEGLLVDGDKTCLAVYKLCVEKLKQRYESGCEVKSSFFCDFNRFLCDQWLNVEAARVTIDFLLLIGSHHFNMIQTLSMFSADCNMGFLSFVCLSTLIDREYRDREFKDPKQFVIIYLFNSIISCLSLSVGLSEVQVGILHSNFRSLIRQSTLGKQENIEQSVPLAITRLIPYHATSKVFALLINQLHFNLYSAFITLLVRVTKTKYDSDRQKFCFNLLESPYITYDEQLRRNHLKIITMLLEALIWPLKSNDEKAVIATIHLINKIFYLQDKETMKAFQAIVSSNPNYSMTKILNYIYENCSAQWHAQKKQINQYFVSVFCNLFLLTNVVPENSYKQFEVLVTSADLQDLVPCIPIFMEVLETKFDDDKGVVFIISNTLVMNALSPNLQNGRFVEGLYNLLFMRGSKGLNVAKTFFAFGFNMQALLERMCVQKYIKLPMFKDLSLRLLHGEDCIMLLDIIVHLHNDVTLPQQFFDFWEEKIKNADVFLDAEIKSISSIFARLIHGKHSLLPHEKAGCLSFIGFVEHNLPQRKFAVCVLRSILATLRILKDILNPSYSVIKKLFTLLEDKVVNLKLYLTEEKKKNINVHLILRDITYYAEIYAVFGDMQDFKMSDNVVTSIVTCLQAVSKSDDYFTEVVDAILRCATVLSIRNDDIMVATDSTLKKVVRGQNTKWRVTSLHCMFDIASSQTQNFDALIPFVSQFMNSSNRELQVYGFKLYISLVEKEYIVPNHLQIFTISHLIAKNSMHGRIPVVEMDRTLLKLTKLFEKYFINTILYFNQYYSHPSYVLSTSDMMKIPTEKVTLEERASVYAAILKGLVPVAKRKVLAHVYTEVFKNIFFSRYDCPKNYEIIQDVIGVTFLILGQPQKIYTKNNKAAYERTLSKIEKIQSDSFRKTAAHEMEYDDVIKSVVRCQLKLLATADDAVKHIVPEVFYLLFAVFDWYYGSICNSMISEKRGSDFCQLVYSLPRLYKANKHLIHFEKHINLQLVESTSNFHRV